MVGAADAHPSGSPGNYVVWVSWSVGVATAVQCMLLRAFAPCLQAVIICCDLRPWLCLYEYISADQVYEDHERNFKYVFSV